MLGLSSYYHTSRWLVVWNHGILFHVLGLSWSQVTNSIIFQKSGLKPPSRYFSSTFSANSAHIFEDFSNIFRFFFPPMFSNLLNYFPIFVKKQFVSNFPILPYVCWTVGVSILKRNTYFPYFKNTWAPQLTLKSLKLHKCNCFVFSSSEHWIALIDYVPWTWSKGKFSRERREQSGFSKANVFPVYSHPANVKYPHCMVPNVWFHPF